MLAQVWMTTAELSMQECVRHAMEVGVTGYPSGKVPERVSWVLGNPGQIVLNGSQVHWTAEVEVTESARACSYFSRFFKLGGAEKWLSTCWLFTFPPPLDSVKKCLIHPI